MWFECDCDDESTWSDWFDESSKNAIVKKQQRINKNKIAKQEIRKEVDIVCLVGNKNLFHWFCCSLWRINK